MSQGHHVTVFGDVMLDVTTVVRPIRLSAEVDAGIIFEEITTTKTPGGAANVAANVASLGSVPQLFGRLGDDDVAGELAGVLRDAHVGWTLSTLPGMWTTRKTRMITQQGRQLLRIDREGKQPNAEPSRQDEVKEVNEIDNLLRYAAVPYEVVVMSDYGKGFCSKQMVATIRRYVIAKGFPWLVDPPRRGSWQPYSSPFTIFKCNRQQALNFLGDKGESLPSGLLVSSIPMRDEHYQELARCVARTLMDRQIQCLYLWITLGVGGAICLCPSESKHTYYYPAQVTDAVVDVCGAGDTALAVMAWHLSQQGRWDINVVRDGVAMAIDGAEIAIQKQGVHRLTATELLAGSPTARHVYDKS